MRHPYENLNDEAFWRKAIAEKHFYDFKNLWQPIQISKDDKIATAGSCFAQHIGNNLQARGADFLDLEPPPPFFADLAEARRFGFSVYSCRYGNIYTSRQLQQLCSEALGERVISEVVWEKNGRFFDALRPGVDPVGQESHEAILKLRAKHLSKVREMLTSVDVFVFTMGLTEGWESNFDQTMYPTAPGTICGQYEEEKYSFHNLSFSEIKSDMEFFREMLMSCNPGARILLTVSPVPLTATASGQHVLVATTYSKSILRAVAGELSESFKNIFYFPSFEIVSSHPFRAAFFNPDMRTVNLAGVDYVMSHFFRGQRDFSDELAVDASEMELICEDESLDLF